MINVIVWNEYRHEKVIDRVKEIYPDGIHSVIKGFLEAEDDLNIICATLDEPECGLSRERVDTADVIIWWGHGAHDEVPDEIVERLHEAILKGCGLIALHSSHLCKIFTKLMGTTCMLRWRDGDRERVYTIAHHHPICKGIPDDFVIPEEEMYGEKFDIPTPNEIIFLSWFSGGEVFRSGVTFERGYGKIFYFRPGHETVPTYKIPVIQQIIKNAVYWAARINTRERLDSPNPAVNEEAV